MRKLVHLGAAALVAATSSAIAENVDATDPAKLVSIVQSLGYRATLDRDNIGDPMIRSSASGTDFIVYFYGCNDGAACKSLLFKVGYDLAEGTTLEAINEWNKQALFGRAYLDEEDDPWLEMSVSLDGGITRESFADDFDWWEGVLVGSEKHIGY